MTLSTPLHAPLTALSAGLRALGRRRSRTGSTDRTAAKDFSALPVCGQFPATAPARVPTQVTERHP